MIRYFVFVVLLASIISPKVLAKPFKFVTLASDTIIDNDSIQVTPYFLKASARSLGNFAVTKPDRIGFQTYAGFNVLNTMRGHVPGLSQDPNVLSGTSTLYTNSALLVIDGMPVAQSIGDYYNLNSFDYQNIYALTGGNSTALYGGPGADGAYFLESKTGENFSRPTFELNLSPMQTWNETTNLTGGTETSNQFLLANAIAYKQDFGVVDTRLSYRYAWLPDGSAEGENHANYHNLRLNTGLSFSRLQARLILDDYYTNNEAEQSYFSLGTPVQTTSKAVRKNLQANLKLQYQILDWLSVSSQSSVGKIQDDNDRLVQTSETQIDREQRRAFVNVYASMHKRVHSNLLLTAFAGYQHEQIKIEASSVSPLNYMESWSEVKTHALLGGAGVQFKDYLYASLDYRRDKYSVFAPDHDNAGTYAINTSFIFSETLGWNNSWFSFGKLRTSYGKNSVAFKQGYPAQWPTAQLGNQYPNPDLHAGAKKMFQTGVDLGFMNNRLTVNASYFDDHHEDYLSLRALPPWMGSGGYVYGNIGTLKTNGWDIIVGGTVIAKEDFSMTSKLIWTTYKTEIELDGMTPGSGSGGDDRTLLGSPSPDWSGNFLHQVEYKSCFMSFLINYRKGGDLVHLDYSSGFPEVVIIDGTIVRLFDLSLGYRLPASMLNKLSLQDAQFSASGRNLWTIYSKSDDTENFSNVAPKNLSLSLTLVF